MSKCSNSGAPAVRSAARRDEHELSCGRCTSSAPHRLPTCRLRRGGKVRKQRALCRKQHLQVEEQDRKFGSHHHRRLRVTYSTASMRRFKRLAGFTTMQSFECRIKVGNSVRTFNEACM